MSTTTRKPGPAAKPQRSTRLTGEQIDAALRRRNRAGAFYVAAIIIGAFGGLITGLLT